MEDCDITKAIIFRMNERRMTPDKMVATTHIKQYSSIGKNNDIYWSNGDLVKTILALNLVEGRASEIVKIRTLERLSREQLVNLIKPSAAMPPQNVNFWENGDSDD